MDDRRVAKEVRPHQEDPGPAHVAPEELRPAWIHPNLLDRHPHLLAHPDAAGRFWRSSVERFLNRVTSRS
jgi:hypothetical protein